MDKEKIYLRVGLWGRTMSSSWSSFTKDREHLLRTQRHQGGLRTGETQPHQSVRKKSKTSAPGGTFLLKNRERLKGWWVETKPKFTIKLIFTCSWAERQWDLAPSILAGQQCSSAACAGQNSSVSKIKGWFLQALKGLVWAVFPMDLFKTRPALPMSVLALGEVSPLGTQPSHVANPFSSQAILQTWPRWRSCHPNLVPREMAVRPPWSLVLSSKRLSREETNHRWHL